MPFKFIRSLVTWIRILLITLVVWFIASFWHEFGLAYQALRTLFQALFIFPNIEMAPPGAFESLWVLVFNGIVGFLFVGGLWLFLISSQAMLPVETLGEMWRTSYHLFLHILGMHGQAVFVEGGEVKATIEDYKRRGPGVVVVDFNSAVVLEERIQPPSILNVFINMGMDILKLFSLSDSYHSPRACGPGIVFTRPYERIRGVVDLRKQSRFQSNVSGYTRDGIELISGGVYVVFSGGEQPERMQVTYQGGFEPENLCVVHIKEDETGNVRITADTAFDEIDEDDRLAIHKQFLQIEDMDWLPYNKLTDPPTLPVYDEKRIFDIVSSTAFSEEEKQSWDKLPTEVAVDIFREIIIQHQYDDFYNPDCLDPHDFPMKAVKESFERSMRNNGMLSYRLIRHASEKDLLADGVYGRHALFTSDIFSMPVSPSKVLRERGISILSAGFMDLKPEADEVYQQRLDSWRATWQQETDIMRAPFEYKAMRARDQARVQAQQELVYDLSRILDTPHTEEVLALRVLQALESAAADPETSQLLPSDTIKLINHVHDWLLEK
jgi:hypothetical protein